MPLFENKELKGRTRDLGDAIATKGLLAEAAEARGGRLAEAQGRRDAAAHDLEQARAASAKLRQKSEDLRRQFNVLGSELAGHRHELAELEAAAAADRAEAAAHRERLRRLGEKRAVLELASESLGALQADSAAGMDHDKALGPLPLASLAAEAGELAERVLGSLEFQLQEAAAKSAVASEERATLEGERAAWAAELLALREEHSPLVEKHARVAKELRAAQAEVVDLQGQRSLMQTQIESATRLREKLYEERARMLSEMGAHKQTVEDIRGMTWQQLGETKEVLCQTSKSLQATEAEQQRRKRELAGLTTAHSKAMASDMTPVQHFRVKLPDPESTHMEAALQRAQAASARVAAREESVHASGASTPLPRLGGPGRAPALAGLNGAPGPEARALEPRDQARVPEQRDRAVVFEQDGTAVWAPDHAGPTARRPSSGRRAGAAPPPSFHKISGPSFAVPSLAASGAAQLAPARAPALSARTPRSDLREAGHLVLGSVRG